MEMEQLVCPFGTRTSNLFCLQAIFIIYYEMASTLKKSIVKVMKKESSLP